MPYVKWTEGGVDLSMSAHPKFGTELKLLLSSERIAELKEGWEGLVASPGSELRIDLPMGWTIFLKPRDGDSRILLAHPDAESWVGMVAIEDTRSAEFQSVLANLLNEGQAFRSSNFPGVNRLSNLELILERN